MCVSSPVIYLLLVSCVTCEHWPQFRGPTADGVAASGNPPVRWSETENVLWKTPIHGIGHSSPVIWGQQVWLTTAEDDGQRLFAICVDRQTGKIRHDREVFRDVVPQPIHASSSHASPTPVVESGRLYAHFGSYGTACLDTDSGDTLWERKDFVVDHRHGPGSSPVVVGKLLVLQFDGMDRQFVVALDKRTGETVWYRPRDIQYNSDNGERKKAFCTPYVVEVGGEQQLVTTAARSVIAYRPENGEVIWRVRFIGDSATARPVFGNDLLYVSTSCVDAKLLAIRPNGHGDVTETAVVWRETRGVPQRPSPLLIGTRLYGIHDQGVLTCRDGLTGNTIGKMRLAGNFAASPIFAGNRIYLPDETGTTVVVDPTQKPQVLAKNQLDGGCMASPAVFGDTIILRTRTHLYAMRETD